MIVLPVCDAWFFEIQDMYGISIGKSVVAVELFIYYPLVILLGFVYSKLFDKPSIKLSLFIFKHLFQGGVCEFLHE